MGFRGGCWTPIRLGQLPVVVGVLVCAGTPVKAGDSNYQNFVIGGRAMGLGGAFTGLANDASGLFYNPGGLVDIEYTSIQLSSSLYGFERQSIEKGSLTLPVPGVESLSPEFTELTIVPASAGFVESFGEVDAQGRPINAFSLSVVVPSFRTFAVNNPKNQDTLTSATGLLVEQPPSYQRRVTDRSLWSGMGYARRLTPKLSFGVAGWYVLRSLSDIEELSVWARVDGTNDAVFRTARNDISLLTGSLVGVAGVKYAVSSRWRLGAAVHTPSFALHSNSAVRFNTADSIPACNDPRCGDEQIFRDGERSRFEPLALENVPSQSRTPWMLRLGVALIEPGRRTLSADISFHLPVRYRLLDVSEALSRRLPFNPEVQRDPVLNVNVGYEHLIVPEVSVALGFFTDFSSAPVIPDIPNEDAQPRNDMLGISLALGYFGEHSLTRLGVMYSFGTGRDVIPTSDLGRLLDDRPSFQSVDFFQSFFYFFVSSTFRY